MKKRRGKLPRGFLLLQDNAPPQISLVVMAAATKCNFEVVSHPLYYPDVAPLDFCLFPNLKTNLCGRNFGSNEGVIDFVEEYSRHQEEYFYSEGISKLEQRWRKRIEAKGNYFEE